jgi:erythromycin esterase
VIATVSTTELTHELTVLGLGEATHGDAASFRSKSQIVKALVEAGWLDVLAWERSAGSLLALDAAVAAGAPDEVAAALGPDMRPWLLVEVQELFQWLACRARDSGQAVRCVGVDVQNPGIARELPELLEEVGASQGAVDLAREIRVTLSQAWPDSSQDEITAVLGFAEALESLVGAEPAVDASLRMGVHSLACWARRALDSTSERPDGLIPGSRDRGMAENVEILTTMGGVCLWAHNGHVSRVPGFAGGYLREALGESYRAAVSVVGWGNESRVVPRGSERAAVGDATTGLTGRPSAAGRAATGPVPDVGSTRLPRAAARQDLWERSHRRRIHDPLGSVLCG